MNTVPPPNTYSPGKRLTVGSHQVVITKYLSQGGFAHVYTCTINPPWRNQTVACLKRVAVPDKSSLNILRREVEAMRRLQGKSYIVSYIDSHAARIENGHGHGYEVFMLMEYCSKNGLIDFMNTRLVHKLTEPEVLNIMGEITEAVSHMHALNPALIHRDIKIENVLISNDNQYKLCDFGSASPPLRPPRNIEEFQILQDDILKNTTPQYRSPEMIDLYRKQPIDEKSDIWALGVFLYKLCYYTTPFEKNAINGNGNAGGGDYAILNGIYSFPSSPPYSARLKNAIAKCLAVDPNLRPNVFQLLEEICNIRGIPYPNVYQKQQSALSQPNEKLPATPKKPIRLPQDNNNGYSNNVSPAKTIHTTTTTSDLRFTPTKPRIGIKDDQFLNYSNLNKSASEYQFEKKRNETPPMLPSHSQINQPKLRNLQRPLSVYDSNDLIRNGSRDSLDLKNLLSDMTTEEVVNLSPKNKDQNIDSSVEFLRSLSRQNSNVSIHNINNSSSHTGSNKNTSKRTSISSLKDLLTGGRSSRDSLRNSSQPSRSASVRHSSSHKNSSTDSLPDFHHRYKLNNNSLATFQEMSPDPPKTKQIPKPNPLSSTSASIAFNSNSQQLQKLQPQHHQPPKRSNSIQRRVHVLLNRKNSPPSTKSAHGYGKYTDSTTTEAPNLPKHPPKQPAKINAKKPVTIPSTTNLPTSGRHSLQLPRRIDPSKLHTVNLSPSISTTTSNTASSFEVSPRSTPSNIFKTPPTETAREFGSLLLPSLSNKSNKLPPPKPRKPVYLQSPKIDSRKNSDASGYFDEDLEVLQKQFNKRFPNAT